MAKYKTKKIDSPLFYDTNNKIIENSYSLFCISIGTISVADNRILFYFRNDKPQINK